MLSALKELLLDFDPVVSKANNAGERGWEAGAVTGVVAIQ